MAPTIFNCSNLIFSNNAYESDEHDQMSDAGNAK